MSGFSKNVIPRRIHKERSQPSTRIAKHGLLEKKKDYKLRARDQNRKMARLKVLKEKASFRNPDEFYYSMINSSTKNGVIRRVVDKKHPDAIPVAARSRDQRLLAETQDSRYVGYKMDLERARIESLKNNLHFIDAAQTAHKQHVIFAGDEDEAEQIVAKRDNESSLPRPLSTGMQKHRVRAYNKLGRLSDRHDKLNTVYQDMSLEKKLLSKGLRKLIRPADKETGAPAVFRWLPRRSR